MKPINVEKLQRLLIRKWRKTHDKRVQDIRAAARSDATAVCEWKHLWKDTEWRSCRPHAGGFYKGDWKDGDPCPYCKAPIKFTEANT